MVYITFFFFFLNQAPQIFPLASTTGGNDANQQQAFFLFQSGDYSWFHVTNCTCFCFLSRRNSVSYEIWGKIRQCRAFSCQDEGNLERVDIYVRSEGLGLKLLHYHFYICNNCITLYILTFSFSFFKIYFSHSLLMQPSILPLHCCSYSYPSSISTAICQRVCCWFFLFFVFFVVIHLFIYFVF